MTLKTLPLVTSPTGTEIGAPVSRTSWPRTRPSVGFKRDRADEVVAEVLGDLERDLVRLVADGDRRLQRVVDAGDGVVRELDVDDRAGDPGDAADAGGLRLVSSKQWLFRS